jgi:outer membrane lipoprotein-sorting protein
MPLSRYLAVLVLFATLPLGGCLFHTHKVEQIDLAALRTATKPDLVGYINSEAAKVQSMQATVDIDTSVGGAKKGQVTEYEQIRGFVLARKPEMLRMIGLYPIVRNRAFDMVSDGHDFKLWIPTKNRFVVGRNDVASPNPDQPLENLRPQIIYEALLLHEISPGETAVLENGTETIFDEKGRPHEQPDYVIDVIRTRGDDSWLSRKIIFSRLDLRPNRQLIYDEAENIVTDARYTDYKDYDGLSFPSKIEIKRPQEEYDITLTILKPGLNQTLTDDKFVLEQPAGAQVIHLDGSQAATTNGGGVH